LSLTFWDTSSQIRLAQPLVAAGADLYARHVRALRLAADSGAVQHEDAADGSSLCLHWRRADFKT
jgi:hypothetical protein